MKMDFKQVVLAASALLVTAGAYAVDAAAAKARGGFGSSGRSYGSGRS